MRLLKKGFVLGLACMVVVGSVNCFSYAKEAKPNVANTMFHFKANNVSYTDIRMKNNNTRTYAVISDGTSLAKVTVMGTNREYSTYSNTCSAECTLKKYTDYTIKNNVYGNNYTYAVLRTRCDSSGSGYWSPDSTKDYNNIG